MRIIIHDTYEAMSKWTAYTIAAKINAAKPNKDNPFVLGLPTGSSPIGTYSNLVALHQQGKVSFKNVVTFNMDEYVGLPEDHPESYHYFMWHHLFSHVDIPHENVNILNGNAKDLDKECEEYEARIKKAGGIQLFLGGIGPDDPGSLNAIWPSGPYRVQRTGVVAFLAHAHQNAHRRYANRQFALLWQ